MQRVGHVQPGDVHARIDQFAQDLRRLGGGAERGDDFGFAHVIRGCRGSEAFESERQGNDLDRTRPLRCDQLQFGAWLVAFAPDVA